MTFAESEIEQAALDWLKGLGYGHAFGPEIASDGEAPEREDYQEVVLVGRLQEALRRLNPLIPEEARAEALRRLRHADQPSLVLNNHAIHRMLVEGVTVEFKDESGRTVSRPVLAL